MEYTVHIGEESLEKLTKILGGESGGGDGELKTAKVTFTNGESQTAVTCELIPGLPDEEDNITFYELKLDIGKGATLDVNAILYKGYASINSRRIHVMSVQGDAEYVEADNLIKISGDCSITIAPTAS